jgi:hypothetical protein
LRQSGVIYQLAYSEARTDIFKVMSAWPYADPVQEIGKLPGESPDHAITLTLADAPDNPGDFQIRPDSLLITFN